MGHFFKNISTGPQLSEYVWVVCRNTKGTFLKSVSKTPTFRFFRDSQPLKRLLHTSSQFWTVFGQNGRNGIFFQKAFGTFFSLLKALTNCKVSEKSNERISRKAIVNERTRAKFKVLSNSSTNQKCLTQKVRGSG